MNFMRTAMLLAFMTALFMGVGFLIGGRGGMNIAFVVAAGMNFFSYWNSDRMVLSSYRAQEVDERTAPEFYLMVKDLARNANLPMPRVYLINEEQPNAFATGAFKNSALVAVSTGLLQRMSRDEVEAVIGHEVAHVANGDMVTMTLIQGVMNTFVVFLSRVIGYFVDKVVLRNEREGTGIGYMITTIVLDIVLGLLAAVIVAWFSRQREFRADAGAAALMGRKQPMINALARLGGVEAGELPQSVKAMGISGAPSGLMALFNSHPPIEDRIRALQNS